MNGFSKSNIFDNKRNNSLDFFKIIFVLLLVVHHSQIFIIRGYIAVEFFFFVSGYFLCKTYNENTDLNTFEYLKKRLTKLYPHYIFSFLILFFIKNIYCGLDGFDVKTIISAVPESVLLQSVGIFHEKSINYPCWYMSVLITASTLIFFLLKKLSLKRYILFAILVILCVYIYLFYCGSLEIWDSIYFFYIPWWRGFADLLLGTLLFYFNKKNIWSNVNIKVIHILELLFLSVLILCIIYKNEKRLDFLSVICIYVYVSILLTSFSFFNRVSRVRLIKWEYAIYLNHAFIIYVMNIVFNNYFHGFLNSDIVRVAILLLITIIYSAFTTRILQLMSKDFARLRIFNKA